MKGGGDGGVALISHQNLKLLNKRDLSVKKGIAVRETELPAESSHKRSSEGESD